MLHADVHGADGPQLVLVHGFTQTGRSWGRAAARLSERHELVLVDAPGHGRSSDVGAGLWEGAELIGERGGRAAYVGYSMGGRFCLHVALSRPELVERLVLVGATAGIEDEAARAERRQADQSWEQLLYEQPLERFVDRWLEGPLFRDLGPAAAARSARLENTAAGLASSLRLAGAGAQEPLWGRLGELGMPVLLVVGERDAKFTAIALRMQQGIGANARLAVVEGAGHAVHLEQPDAFAAIVERFVGGHG
jgi:2-succinyl-6-hydroxy-2,4-cyclohexadiene-1-carboxylate synthase